LGLTQFLHDLPFSWFRRAYSPKFLELLFFAIFRLPLQRRGSTLDIILHIWQP